MRTTIRSGVTRTVYVGARYVMKVPALRWGRRAVPVNAFLRGWLANRSEWEQRRRPDVMGPTFTIAYVAQWYPLVDEVGTWEPEDCPFSNPSPEAIERDEDDWAPEVHRGYRAEEAQGSNWGRYGSRWFLIDYDRAWQHPRGWIGGLYYGRQERLTRERARATQAPDPR